MELIFTKIEKINSIHNYLLTSYFTGATIYWEADTMTYKNGIYLSLNGDSAVRIISENGAKIQTDVIKIADELLGELEFNLSTYEEAVKHITELSEPQGEFGEELSEDQFAKVSELALDLADGVMENDLPAGVLLRATIENLLDSPDDGTAMYFLTTMNNVIDALREPMHTQFYLYKYLRQCHKFAAPKEWLEKSVLHDKDFFRREYWCEFVNYDLFINEPRLSQVFFFDNYSDYYVFLFLQFATQQKRVQECPCCGKFFIPKSNRREVYCDRIIYNGKSCKEIAPKLLRKVKQQDDSILKEYELAKNRNYKRVERYENADFDSKVMQMEFSQYKAWLERASAVKKLYLQGKVSAEEFRSVIEELK